MIEVRRNDFLALDFLAAHEQEPKRDDFVGAIFVRDGTEVIGAAGLNERRGRHDALVHVAGHGWSRKSLSIWFAWVFGALGLSRISAEVEASNVASAAFAEGLGFVREGVKRAGHARGGDLILFGLLRSECRYWKEIGHG